MRRQRDWDGPPVMYMFLVSTSYIFEFVGTTAPEVTKVSISGMCHIVTTSVKNDVIFAQLQNEFTASQTGQKQQKRVGGPGGKGRSNNTPSGDLAEEVK